MHSIDVEQEYADISAYLSGSLVGESSNIYLPLEEELCFDSNGVRVSPSSPDCKLDIYLEEIDKTVDPYKSKIIRGCYNR